MTNGIIYNCSLLVAVLVEIFVITRFDAHDIRGLYWAIGIGFAICMIGLILDEVI
jgi:uncharacterized membrane protein YgaE (UPF0421/DUF939 family)